MTERRTSTVAGKAAAARIVAAFFLYAVGILVLLLSADAPIVAL